MHMATGPDDHCVTFHSCVSHSKWWCTTLLAAGGTGSILLWGAKGSKDVALPIQQGPKKGGEKGPRGKI